MRKLKYLILPLVILAAVTVWLVVRNGSGGGPETVRPLKTDIIEAVYATGEVEPKVWLRVEPQVSARFVEVMADDGDTVARGEVLAKADDAAERARLAEFKARLGQMKNEYERNRQLAAEGSISRKAFDAAAADYNELSSRIENQKRLIERMSLTSPIAGVILRRDLEPGEMKSPGQAVFWVGQPGSLRITAEVDEEDILRVKQGQTALLKTDALENTVLEGRVAEITPKGDPVSKSFRIRIDLPETTPLLIGMTVEVNIVTGRTDNALVVPVDAVKNGAVYVVQGGRAVRTPVTLGKSDGKVVQITGGVTEAQTLLAKAR